MENCNNKKAEELLKNISSIIQELDDDCRKSYTATFIIEAINWGSDNFYEAIGILEDCKQVYREHWQEAMEDEMNNETRKEIKL